jgi:anti-sigma regulatory factor (Ser/Thr protein kinase)
VTAEQERQPGRGTAPAESKSTAVDQAFDADSLYALRAAVAAHAAAAGLGRHRVYDVTAVAHELAANAVVHGAGHGRLRLWAAGGFLYCQVSDGGRDATGNQSAPPARPGDGAAPWPVQHGHGLWLVRQVADHVDIIPGPAGTTATVRFPLGPR